MGWLWSSNTPAENKSSTPTASSSTLPTPTDASIPSETQRRVHRDAELHSAYPHLGPAPSVTDKSESASTPQSSPELSPEYPTTMSCRAAFDSAFYCSSLGGHFNHIYRYGELRSCSEHWADWRFCMGLKTRTKADREILIQERYRQKEEKMKEQPNSEYVWEKRREGERYYGAFRHVDTDAKQQ